MCTVSIYRTSTNALVTMNRDEAVGRAPEAPPALHDGPVPWAAPRDGEKGGTWMGANARGVVACLLNFYLPGESLLPDTSGRYRSRGEIVPNLLGQGEVHDAIAWLLEDFDPSPYPSFSLHVISPNVSRRFVWIKQDGLEMEDVEGEWRVFSSSGWDSAEVIRWREREFARWLEGGGKMAGMLPAFNLLQKPGHEHESPLMQREWSATRSVTQAYVSSAEKHVALRYWPNPRPNSCEPSSVVELPLSHPSDVSSQARTR